MKVPLHIAILGGTIKVPTVDGDVEVTIPAGLQPSDRKVLRGRGIPRLRTLERGDQLLEFDISIPRRLDPQQRRLIQEAFAPEEAKKKQPEPEKSESSHQEDENKKGFFKSAMDMLKGEK